MSCEKKRLAILISGRGSNMESLIKACLCDGSYPAQVVCVISDSFKAEGLKLASSYGITTFVINNKSNDFSSIHEILDCNKIDLVCLAGFMKVINDNDFLSYWNGKIINVHPSLLPSFKGLNAQKKALDSGVKISGCSIHYVTREIDSGPIVFQAAVPILNNDTLDTLSKRILKAEHIIYPLSVKLIALGQISIINNKVVSLIDNLSRTFF